MAKKDEDRILTLHPSGKKGTNILRSKYELIKDAIIIYSLQMWFDAISNQTSSSNSFFMDIWTSFNDTVAQMVKFGKNKSSFMFSSK